MSKLSQKKKIKLISLAEYIVYAFILIITITIIVLFFL